MFNLFSKVIIKEGGGSRVKNTSCAYLDRVFSYEFNGFRFVKKFQVLFEISRQEAWRK